MYNETLICRNFTTIFTHFTPFLLSQYISCASELKLYENVDKAPIPGMIEHLSLSILENVLSYLLKKAIDIFRLVCMLKDSINLFARNEKNQNI